MSLDLAEAPGGFSARLLQSSADAIALLDAAGRVQFLNDAALGALDLSVGEGLGAPWYRLWPDSEAPRQALVAAASGKGGRFQIQGRSPAERPRVWDIRVDPLRDETGQVVQMLAIGRDVTAEAEQRRRQAQLAHDANHRVKNGLQMVQSLLSLRGRMAPEPAAAELKASAARVHAISLLHDQLRRGQDGMDMEADAYLAALIPALRHALAEGSDGNPRAITLDHADGPLWPSAELSMLGLVLTELVTNAVHHGQGAIRIAFRQPPGAAATLTVADAGPAPRDYRPGLGLQMAEGLLASQGGALSLDPESGTTCFVATLPRGEDDPGV